MPSNIFEQQFSELLVKEKKKQKRKHLIIKNKRGRWLQTKLSRVLLQNQVEPRTFPKAARIKNQVLTKAPFLKNVKSSCYSSSSSEVFHICSPFQTYMNKCLEYLQHQEKKNKICGSHLFTFFHLKYPTQ